MFYTEDIIIPYGRPTTFIDSYAMYTEAEKMHILKSTELTYDDFAKLFAPCPIGAYEESVFFLPHILKYIEKNHSLIIFAQDEHFKELINNFFIWIVMYNHFLLQDNIWKFVDSFLYNFFTMLTEQYKLDECNTPLGAEYIDIFLYSFSYRGKEHNMTNLTDRYLVQRFTSFESYVDCAWFVFMVYSFMSPNRGLRNAHYSEVISYWHKDATLRANATTGIIREVCQNPTLADYWTVLLDQAMLF